jgi:hypothetical protein
VVRKQPAELPQLLPPRLVRVWLEGTLEKGFEFTEQEVVIGREL